ncbi:hypothetical protein HPP92_021332 [Vanilla planifolia]|uniref:DUF2232 domain-containing protein n=1 Tax=Vanilla planifolia TaxID=51239 RepID=A0A835Q2B5_VANPL|nr:hypothetical protein HPP92_021332 [Vanilla planifolia]
MSLFGQFQLAGVSSLLIPSRISSRPRRFTTHSITLSFAKADRSLLGSYHFSFPRHSVSPANQPRARASLDRADERQNQKEEEEYDDLAVEGEGFQKTLRLVECSMFASVGGLAYFLSNSLAIENYLGCFFSLPIVISSMRWGVAAGRKTMVATTVLLFTLGGPVKACTYMLMHGLVGLAMGSLWRLRINWGISLALCTLVRVIGIMGYVLLTSFLIRENILNLITINVHASLTYVLTAVGVNIVPTMDVIYAIFGILVFLNCGFFVLLLHILYAIFLSKLGMKDSLAFPGWLEKTI